MKTLVARLRRLSRLQKALLVSAGVLTGTLLGIAGHPLVGLFLFGGSAILFNIATKE
jgi:hypothetical protein